MPVADRQGLPTAFDVASASPAEVRLVGTTLDACFIEEVPKRLSGDNAYDSDTLAQALGGAGIELIVPNRRNRKIKSQDGRPLQRYARRRKINRLFTRLQNFRGPVNRWEHDVINFPSFVHLGCIVILLRR
jgi:hypothetical protein